MNNYEFQNLKIVHKLFIHPYYARTACGMEIVAYYPRTHRAMPMLMQNMINVHGKSAEVTCPDCLTKMALKKVRFNAKA